MAANKSFSPSARSIIISVVIIIIASGWTFKDAITGRGASDYKCPPNAYTIRIVSYSPLIMHLENFLTNREREHLISIGLPNLSQSLIMDKTSGKQIPNPARTSSSGYLDSKDPIVQCVRKRALQFQGYEPPSLLEPLQVVQYFAGQEYRNHYDWGVPPGSGSALDRVTTFFVTLQGSCEHCGTRFPYLNVNWTMQNPEWCHVIDCDLSSVDDGTAFRALEGAALFWRNLDEEGKGDERVLHSGMKLTKGSKIGLNIWTRGV